MDSHGVYQAALWVIVLITSPSVKVPVLGASLFNRDVVVSRMRRDDSIGFPGKRQSSAPYTTLYPIHTLNASSPLGGSRLPATADEMLCIGPVNDLTFLDYPHSSPPLWAFRRLTSVFGGNCLYGLSSNLGREVGGHSKRRLMPWHHSIDNGI